MKTFKEWKNEKQYFELSQNPSAPPIPKPINTNPIQRGATSPIVPAQVQGASTSPAKSGESNGAVNDVLDADPTYNAMVQELNGNVQQFTTKLIKALKGKTPQIVMAVQAAVNQAVNEILRDKGASFARRANLGAIQTARANLKPSTN